MAAGIEPGLAGGVRRRRYSQTASSELELSYSVSNAPSVNPTGKLQSDAVGPKPEPLFA